MLLKDKRIERRILDSLGLLPGDLVLEIGAGPGNMTELLAARAGSLVAVELDRKFAAALRLKFAGNPKVEIREGNILDVPISAVASAAGREKLKVYGNLPYYITTPCLMHLFHHCDSIEEIVVMVQEEVAKRIVAQPKSKRASTDYGLLSLTCQYYTRPELLFSVGPGSFSPPPQVRSAVVRMRVAPLRKALDISAGEETAFWSFVRAAFSQKRKMLVNNWKGLYEAERLLKAMERAGVDPQVRAEALSLQEFAALYHALRHRK